MRLALICLFVSILAAVPGLAAAPGELAQSSFEAEAGASPAGWQSWAARAEIAPKTFVSREHDRGGPGALAIAGDGNRAAYGGWQRRVESIEPGHWYRFVAYYRAEGVADENLQVLSRLDWRKASGERAGHPDYVHAVTSEGGWKRVSLEAPAPEDAAAVDIQLFLSNAPQGRVWWDEISLSRIDPPGPRLVRVAAVNLRPRNTGGPEQSVQRFLDVVEQRVAAGDTDIIVLPEGITVVGTGKKYADVAETIPGPTTAALGKMARRKNAYISAGIYERDGVAIYNTAVLVDREGKLAGKYRKVYLPREEIEGGITPGNDYPVFQTDFGKVGMMICWDIQYADPARALALRGAELILTPIWGGNETLGKARAIENRVFIASSGYDYPTQIMDPDGKILALAKDEGTVAFTTIDLNRRYLEPWLGDMRGRFMKELRLDVPVRR